MSAESYPECCARFDPAPWDEKERTWDRKAFVTDRVRSFLHIPLNFASVMKRNVALIEQARAKPDALIVLADECSPWRTDVYIDVTGDVPGARMATISGTFLSKVFEGPYHHVGKWMKEMRSYVSSKGKQLKKMYCYYTTCPKCAKKYGKNYVVLVAEV
ncbi:MAG: hydrolase [Planctomycetota bacterium]